MTEDTRFDSDAEMGRTMVFAPSTLALAGIPAEQQREHVLTMVEGPTRGLRLPLGLSPLCIGRHPDNTLCIPDAGVSSHHCEISVPPGSVDARVADRGSTNGSFLEGVRVQGSAAFPPGAMLRIGRVLLKHEVLLASELAQAEEHARDLEKARHYVQSLLPAPIEDGPLRTDWVFQPSAQLGGDVFGYQQLDAQTFAGYLVDVSGHGVGAAMHGVSVMNVLRQRALPQADLREPAQVLRSLNEMFQMDSHDGMFFSVWYGVYDTGTRELRYASGGHHPSYLRAPGAALEPLQTRNLVIGAMPGMQFRDARTVVAPGSRLYIFSDGVFEVATRDGGQWGLPDFLPVLAAGPEAGLSESARILREVRKVAREGPFDDDFSAVTVTFPS
ncbi:MAG TPA: SpoIIE family protein phosphatase [Ramlibacter sp.]|nr:SpoIIE family protein phosphatase [Ramlibacter sp.]